MRVLVATPSLPLPFGKADARWLYVVVKGLAARGHEVVCLACTEADENQVAVAAAGAEADGYRLRHVPLVLDPSSVLKRKIGSLVRPFSEYEKVAALRLAFDEEAASADIVHVEHLFNSRIAVEHPKAVTYLHHLEIIDWEQRTDLDLRTRVTRLQMERATSQILSSTRRVLGATSRIVARVKATNPSIEAAIVPVSIDPSLYPDLPLTRDPVVGVIGSMHWYPSRSAADRVLVDLWPRIHEQVPEARLLVAGWGSEENLGHRFPLEGAELLGAVDSPEDFFGEISLLLYPPARGSGFKIKVLEAMAYGRAAISNGEGLEGLTDRGDLVAVAAETDDELVAATVDLARDPDRRASLGASGRIQVVDVYSPEPAIERLLDAYDEVGLLTPRLRARA